VVYTAATHLMERGASAEWLLVVYNILKISKGGSKGIWATSNLKDYVWSVVDLE